MLLHKLLAEAGLSVGTMVDKPDVTVEVMAPVQMPEAIQYDEEGEVAGYIVAEPFGSKAVLEGYGEEFALTKDLWPNHPCCVLVAQEELTQKNPDAVLELVRSLTASGVDIQNNPAAAVETGSPFLGQDPKVLNRVLSSDRIRTGELLPVMEDLITIQDYIHDKMKLMQTKIDMEKFVDDSFAREAKA